MKKAKTIFSALPTKYFLLAIIALSAIVRLIFVARASIWHDEGYTMMLIKHDVVGIIERTARDVHPPLYYLVAHAWQFIAGDSEFAIRGLSVIFGVGTVIVAYFIMRKLFSEKVARLSALFLALGPFLIRYSDEARMYAMATFLIVLATWLLILAVEKNYFKKTQWIIWSLYGITAAAALYTHYYVVFLIPVHIGYVIWKQGFLNVLKNRKWWAGNILAVALFAPWVPSLLAQFTRVQSGFWIPPVDAETLPNTYLQFLAFGSNSLAPWIEVIIALAISAAVVAAIVINKKNRGSLLFLTAWFAVPLVLVIIISLSRPVYYDRYFTFSAVAFSCLLAATIYSFDKFKPSRYIKPAIIVILCAVFISGIGSVYSAAGWSRMREVGSYVSTNYQTGDAIVSAELYTYFHFSYYNKTATETKLLSKDALSGYGETSLIYDRQDELVVKKFDDISSSTNRVWVIGKPGNEYWETIPKSWQEQSRIEANDSTTRLYTIRPIEE